MLCLYSAGRQLCNLILRHDQSEVNQKDITLNDELSLLIYRAGKKYRKKGRKKALLSLGWALDLGLGLELGSIISSVSFLEISLLSRLMFISHW